MNKARQLEIQHIVRELHERVWRNKEKLWPQGTPKPINMLHPLVAAHTLGVKYQEVESFAGQQFTAKTVGRKLAGQLDRENKTVTVALEFGAEMARFTGAHEIAHFVLHPGKGMFRDRPIGDQGGSQQRPEEEKEADYFGACWLMPVNLLVDEFEKRFGPAPLTFDTHVANQLNPAEIDALMGAEEDDIIREFELAKCGYFYGQHILPLHKAFRVSKTAMAYRLKELKLISWP